MKKRVLVLVSCLLASTVSWFLAVDLSVFDEECPDCRLRRDILQYRLLGVVVSEKTREYALSISRMAADLGVPCSHARLRRRHLARYWGLAYCTPYFRGMRCLTGPEWYDAKASEIAKRKARENPGLAEEFRRRVLQEHDMKYLRGFIHEIVGEVE